MKDVITITNPSITADYKNVLVIGPGSGPVFPHQDYMPIHKGRDRNPALLARLLSRITKGN
jgi:hypothetical protein